MKSINIILLGPQGSGKGTQASWLAREYRLFHLEMGKIFRQLTREKSALGRQLNKLVNVQGLLVPDSLTVKILASRLKRISRARGIVFDGYPRTINQARALDRLLIRLGRTIGLVIYIPISRKVTVKRLGLRRVCSNCGRVYIFGVDIKSTAARCPNCRGRLVRRADDTPAAINRRLKIFHRDTAPIVSYYKKQGNLIVINGEPSIGTVTQSVKMVINKLWSELKTKKK